MKRILFFAGIILVLTSCFDKMLNHSLIDAATDALEGDAPFVITLDGKKIKGDEIKIIKHGKTSDDVMLDGKHYVQKDLEAVQTKDVYYTNFGGYWWGRIQKGKVEAYLFTTTNTSTQKSVTQCKIRKNKDALQDYTTRNLYNLISDKKSTIEIFNETYKTVKDKTPLDFNYKSLRKVLEDYN